LLVLISSSPAVSSYYRQDDFRYFYSSDLLDILKMHDLHKYFM
jgi:hypothetical protein